MAEKNKNVKSSKDFMESQACEVIKHINTNGLLASPGENVAVTLNKIKTVALCYDRVWCPLLENEHKQIPKQIRCWNISPLKIAIMSGSPKKTSHLLKRILRPLARKMSEKFTPGLNMSFTTVYESSAERDNAYSRGDREAILSSLSNLQIIDESCLTWEQVLEFRKDVGNKTKYKRFLHWLEKELIEKSQAFIEDEISLRLEGYENAMRKHGIKTVVGTIEEVLDGKYLLVASGVAGTLTIAGHPVLGMLAGTGLFIGKVGVKLIQTKIDFDDVERGPNSEISWVYEVKRLGK